MLNVRLFVRPAICLPALCLVVICLSAISVAEENWPHWRGPANNGISSETNLPAEFGPKQNKIGRASCRARV